MKKLTSIVTSLLLIGVSFTTSLAQEARGGIKGGLNLSNLYVDDVDDENVRAGFHAGVYTQLMIGETFALQPEINFSMKGAETEYDDNSTGDFNLSYIDVPVLATFKLGDAVDIHVGPYFGYLVGANVTTEGGFLDIDEDLDRDHFHKWDSGLSAGLTFNFDALGIGLRYNYGLSEIAESDAAEVALGDAKNSFAQVYVSFNLMP